MACCETKIISVATVREITGLNKNVDDRKIAPFLKLAQEELEKVLGRTLYEELETAIIADDTLATEADLLALMGYLKGPLAWRTLQRALPRMAAEPTANGVHTTNSTEYSSVDSRALSQQITDARTAADNGYDRLLAYINENLSTYTTYGDVVDDEERVKKVYKGGVITRKSRWQYPYGLKAYKGRNGNQYDECCDAD